MEHPEFWLTLRSFIEISQHISVTDTGQEAAMIIFSSLLTIPAMPVVIVYHSDIANYITFPDLSTTAFNITAGCSTKTAHGVLSHSGLRGKHESGTPL